MTEKNYTNLILKKLSGEINKIDLQKLEEWLGENAEHQDQYNEVEKIWQLTGGETTEIDLNVNKEWSKFQTRIAEKVEEKETTKVRSLWSGNLLRIAASVLFLVAAFGIFQMMNKGDEWTTVYAKAEKKEIRLPDNSVVWLNENSEIAYQENFEERLIKLKGEAYFDVQKKNGATFTIETAQTKTQVLGTTFNVKAYADQATVEVAVFTGKVSFDGLDDEQAEIILTPNEKGTYQKNKKVISKEENEDLNTLAWKQNKLEFKGALMKDIIPTIERFYNIKVTVSDPSILNCDFSGTFNQLSPEDMMESLAFGLSLTTNKTAASFELLGKGCK